MIKPVLMSIRRQFTKFFPYPIPNNGGNQLVFSRWQYFINPQNKLIAFLSSLSFKSIPMHFLSNRKIIPYTLNGNDFHSRVCLKVISEFGDIDIQVSGIEIAVVIP